MLTVAKVTGNMAAGYAEYLEGKTTATELGDYYLKDGERVEAPGRWVTGAELVGCDPDKPVGGKVLRELMAVRNPSTGEQLRRVGASGEAVAALDATFSAPKSVSAVWAVSDPNQRARIEHAHEQAITRALTYATGQVRMVRERTGPDAVVHRKATDLIATSWRHTTARAVGDRVPDPQLHSHVLLHAAVRGDGKVVAIDSRSWLVHRRELGAAYRTELARGMIELGYRIERYTGRGGRYFEIAGLPQVLLDAWSSRHHQVQEAIEQQLAKTGSRSLSAAQERRAALSTRQSKQPTTSMDLDNAWQTTARNMGLGHQQAEMLTDSGPELIPAVDRRTLLTGLTEFDATFTDRQANAVALEQSAGASIEQALTALDQAREDCAVIRLADGTSTTSWHRALERSTVQTFDTISRERLQEIPGRYVEQALEVVNRQLGVAGGSLSAEQVNALRLACSDRQVVMIEGQAGTGKSTLLQAIALAHQTNGNHIIVTSTAAVAAERLSRELQAAGVDAPAYSTVALQHAIDNDRIDLNARSTIIHDEAALASTREQQQLLEAVEERWAHLIIVGDPAQSKPIGAAGLWPHLERLAEMQESRAELTVNLRARDVNDQRDQKLFRDGQHEEALRGYAERQRLRIVADQQTAEQQALELARRDRAAGKRTVVIAQTSNEHLDELNAQAQALRLRDGELGQNGLAVSGRPYRIHAGDDVQIRHTIRVDDDEVRNGTTGTIADVDARREVLTVTFDDGREITLGRDDINSADLRLAYVQHPVPAQGITTDTAHLIVSEHATREGTYVALTRARERTDLHMGNELLGAADGEILEALAEHVGRDEPQVPSIEVPVTPELEQTIEIMDAPQRLLDRGLGQGWEL